MVLKRVSKPTMESKLKNCEEKDRGQSLGCLKDISSWPLSV